MNTTPSPFSKRLIVLESHIAEVKQEQQQEDSESNLGTQFVPCPGKEFNSSYCD